MCLESELQWQCLTIEVRFQKMYGFSIVILIAQGGDSASLARNNILPQVCDGTALIEQGFKAW